MLHVGHGVGDGGGRPVAIIVVVAQVLARDRIHVVVCGASIVL